MRIHLYDARIFHGNRLWNDHNQIILRSIHKLLHIRTHNSLWHFSCRQIFCSVYNFLASSSFFLTFFQSLWIWRMWFCNNKPASPHASFTLSLTFAVAFSLAVVLSHSSIFIPMKNSTFTFWRTKGNCFEYERMKENKRRIESHFTYSIRARQKKLTNAGYKTNMIELLYTLFSSSFCLVPPIFISVSVSVSTISRFNFHLIFHFYAILHPFCFAFFSVNENVYFPFSIKISSPYAAYMEPDLWRTINWLHSGSLETLSHWGDPLLLLLFLLCCDTLQKDKKKRQTI